SLKSNRILNPGDTIALGVPIFTPYLEMAHLEDYDLHFVEVHAKQEQKFQYPDEEIKKLLDPKVKAFFIVNPGNPFAVALSPETIKKKLGKRYGTLTLEPRKLAFIDRIVADSRDVALNHTAGLSLPQQVMMTMFSLSELMDAKKDYQKACLGICKKRVEATIE